MASKLNTPIKIVIADDHNIVADGVRQILSNIPNFNVIATATNGVEAIQVIKNNEIDVVVMDINMPDMNGIKATQIISENYSTTKVLIMSNYNRYLYIQEAINSGANGYILKNTTPQELEMAITKVAEGGNYFSAEVSENMSIEPEVNHSNNIKVSKKEIQILRQLSEGFTLNEISKQMDSSLNNINAYRRNLIIKFNVKTTAQLIAETIKGDYLNNNN